jgi:hypothetical protein
LTAERCHASTIIKDVICRLTDIRQLKQGSPHDLWENKPNPASFHQRTPVVASLQPYRIALPRKVRRLFDATASVSTNACPAPFSACLFYFN